MSKKHPTSSHQTPAEPLSHAAEYRIIQHDLVRVALLNALYLAAVLVLFYVNNRSHFLDTLLVRWFHL